MSSDQLLTRDQFRINDLNRQIQYRQLYQDSTSHVQLEISTIVDTMVYLIKEQQSSALCMDYFYLKRPRIDTPHYTEMVYAQLNSKLRPFQYYVSHIFNTPTLDTWTISPMSNDYIQLLSETKSLVSEHDKFKLA